MIAILKSLDSREIATAIWLLIFIAWCFTRPNIRKSLGGVLSVATTRPIATTLVMVIVYLAAVTLVLRNFELWTLAQFKITVFWFLFAGVPALMDIPEISKNPALLKAAAAKNFKLSLLLDFFINLYKLPLLGELFFVPFVALLGGLLAVAQSNDKYAPVQKLLNGVLVTVGLCLVFFQAYKLMTSFEEVNNADKLRDFALPVLYNFIFIPFMWAMSIYAAYDSVFCRLQFVIRDRSLQLYARRKLIAGFRTDIVALNIWFKLAWSGAFNSRGDVDQSISAVAKTARQ